MCRSDFCQEENKGRLVSSWEAVIFDNANLPCGSSALALFSPHYRNWKLEDSMSVSLVGACRRTSRPACYHVQVTPEGPHQLSDGK